MAGDSGGPGCRKERCKERRRPQCVLIDMAGPGTCKPLGLAKGMQGVGVCFGHSQRRETFGIVRMFPSVAGHLRAARVGG